MLSSVGQLIQYITALFISQAFLHSFLKNFLKYFFFCFLPFNSAKTAILYYIRNYTGKSVRIPLALANSLTTRPSVDKLKGGGKTSCRI